MYRCFMCDTPAQMNCACYTQVEEPECKETGCPKQEPEKKKINIASGEDVMEEYAYP